MAAVVCCYGDNMLEDTSFNHRCSMDLNLKHVDVSGNVCSIPDLNSLD